MTNLDRVLKSRDTTLPTKVCVSQGYGLPSGHVRLRALDCKEGRVLKNWCLQTVMLEKTLESLLDSKIKPVHPKENQSWIFIGRTDAETEAPILWPSNVKKRLVRKDPDAEKDRKQKGTTENGMVEWHHWLDGHALSKLWDMVKEREAWRSAVHGVTKSQTQLSDWNEVNRAEMSVVAHNKGYVFYRIS